MIYSTSFSNLFLLQVSRKRRLGTQPAITWTVGRNEEKEEEEKRRCERKEGKKGNRKHKGGRDIDE